MKSTSRACVSLGGALVLLILASCGNYLANAEGGIRNPPYLRENGAPIGPDDSCGAIEVDATRPCRVSFLQLIAAPEYYHGRWIKVIGYYPGGSAKILFPGYESWNTNDNRSSLLLEGRDWLPQDVKGYYAAIGIFSFDQAERNLAPGIFRQFGVLSPTVGLYKVPLMEERENECRRTGCSIIYDKGVAPVTYD